MSSLTVSICIILVLIMFFVFYPVVKSSKISLMLASCLSLFLSSASVFFYIQWGNYPAYQAQVHKKQLSKQVATFKKQYDSPEKIISIMKQRLQEHPSSAKGWYLLGKLYVSQQDYQNAQQSFEKAHHLDPSVNEYSLALIENDLILNKNNLGANHRNLLSEILKQTPNNPSALSMLAVDEYTQHHYEKAVSLWEHLLDIIGTNSEEAKTILDAISEAQKKQHSDFIK